MVDFARIDWLTTKLSDYVASQGVFERSVFDPVGTKLLWILVDRQMQTKVPSVRMSRSHLGRILRTSVKIVRSRMVGLSRYGLIRVETPKSKTHPMIRDTPYIYVNPMIINMMSPDCYTRQKMAVIKHWASVGIRRLEYEDDIQGFYGDCLYGHPEPKDCEPMAVEKQFDEILGRESEEKARRSRENQTWREYSEAFVKGASEIWVRCQMALGYGSARPNWEGDIATLSSSAKKERYELAKTLEAYGGRVSALSWYIFCAGSPELDKFGRPIFSNFTPHRQFISIDKKPSSFSKHFNAILKDTMFLHLSQNEWATTSEELKIYFGGIIEVAPRNNTEYEKIGYEFGSSRPSVESITGDIG